LSFATTLALLVGLLAAVPLLAHLLRRQRARDVPLPTAKLLAASLPSARRRRALEDRGLLSLRVLAILALALLGATPFVRCSELGLARRDGASVAMVFVVDDSLSMRAKLPDGRTRFEAAKKAALDLVGQAEEGDAFGLVLAGKPARIELAPTTDHGAARVAVEGLEASDRATDLTVAIDSARALLSKLPQPDKRVVLLSDRADASAAGTLASGDATLWYPLTDLIADPQTRDCAVVSATLRGTTVTVETRCVGPDSSRDRELLLTEAGAPDREVARAPLLEEGGTLTLSLGAKPTVDLDARLTGSDAIVEDDAAPVFFQTAELAIGVVSEARDPALETGGPPPVEQALAALDLGVTVRSLTAVPDRDEDLTALRGLLLDDPTGLTPEERSSVTAWVERGGPLMIALGKRAETAGLAESFGALVPGVVRWESSAPRGARVADCTALGPSAESFADLAPRGRARLELPLFKDDPRLCSWEDGEPLVLVRTLARGSVTLVTESFQLDASDLPLRPAFLALLEGFVGQARESTGAGRVLVGQTILLKGGADGPGQRVVPGATKPVELPSLAEGGSLATSLVGRYTFAQGGSPVVRIATLAPEELTFEPSPLQEGASDSTLGGQERDRDISPLVAFALLALLVVEAIVRLRTSPAAEA
jgi:hypothetical protein